MSTELRDQLVGRIATELRELGMKLDGASDYDARRPLTPSGSNLLGLVQHVSLVSLEYAGVCFGREVQLPAPFDQIDPDGDGDWVVGADVTREQVLGLLELAVAQVQRTGGELDLDSQGRVPWWNRDVTFGQVMVHLLGEVARHAGHADILRESVDGQAGLRPNDPNFSRTDQQSADRVAQLQAIADTFAKDAP